MNPGTGTDSKNKHKINSPPENVGMQEKWGIPKLNNPASPDWNKRKLLLAEIKIEWVLMASFKKHSLMSMLDYCQFNEWSQIFVLRIMSIKFLVSFFTLWAFSGRVLELLINSEKSSTPPTFEENAEIFLCLRFSITQGHDPPSLNLKFASSILYFENNRSSSRS